MSNTKVTRCPNATVCADDFILSTPAHRLGVHVSELSYVYINNAKLSKYAMLFENLAERVCNT